MIRLGSALFCWMLWLFAASTAQAQTSVVIVVPHSTTDDFTPYEHRLRSELISEGFQPVSVEVPAEVSSPMLKQNATRLLSPAAISLSIRDGAISGLVFIQSRGRGGDLLRGVPEYPLSGQAPAVFAVKAADVLHGGLLELGYIGTVPAPPPPATKSDATAAPPPPATKSDAISAPPRQAAVVSPTPEKVESLATPQPKAIAEKPAPKSQQSSSPESPTRRSSAADTWQFRGMFSIVRHTQRSPNSLGGTISATGRVHANWRVGLAGTYLDDVRVRTTPYWGEAAVVQAFIGPRLELSQILVSELTAFAFLEAGAHALLVSGEADPPNSPQTTHAYTGYANLGLGAALGIGHGIGVVAQTGLLLPFQPADVIVAGTPVIEAAGPALHLNAGLELSL